MLKKACNLVLCYGQLKLEKGESEIGKLEDWEIERTTIGCFSCSGDLKS